MVSIDLALQEELVVVLVQIPRMEEKEIRDGLLWPLKPEEKDIVQPRSDDMTEDLKNIVRGMAELGKLHLLVSTAKRRPMSTDLQDRLDRIFERLVSRKYR